MDDMTTEVATHHAVPPGSSLIHLVLQVPRDDSFLPVIFYWLFECLLDELGYFGQFFRVHVGGLDNGF